jgi:serine/threonine protein kinase
VTDASELVESSALTKRPHEPAHETGFWVDRFVEEWRLDPTLTTMSFCRRYPQLEADLRLLTVIGYEEFCQRTEAGEELGAAFLQQFPDGGEGLRELIGIHAYAGGHSSFLPGLLKLPSALLDHLSESSQSEWPEPGETVAGFHLLELMGTGGSARVYVAEELALGRRKVVVKVSRVSTAEAHTLGRLRHPNIVPVYSVSVDAHRKLTLICMPYLGRTTLNDVLGRMFDGGRPPRFGKDLLAAIADHESLAVDESPAADVGAGADVQLAGGSYVDAVVHLGAQMAEALSYTHRQNICHRDLKPSNVLLDRSGKPLLLDFHLSSPEGAQGRHWGGTLYYMAPEAVKQVMDGGDAPAADPRSDIYSLGVVLYGLLCGEGPFGAPSRGPVTPEMARELYSRQRQPPLAGLMARCLSFDVEARPPSAEHLARALRRLAGRGGRWRRWMWRHRGPLRTVQAATCLGALVVGFALAGQPSYGERQFLAAKRAAEQGDCQVALAKLDAAETAGYQPRAVVQLRADVYYRLAAKAFLAGDYLAALEHSSLLLRLEPARWQAYLLRARTHLRLGDAAAALVDANRAGAIDSAPQVAALRGDCCCAQRNWKLAIEAYRFATAAGFESAGLYNNLAHALIKSNRREQALRWLDLALEKEPLPDAYYQRASLSLALAVDHHRPPPPQAAKDIETAIALLPGNYRPHLVAANVYAVLAEHGGAGEREVSLRHLLDALRLGLRANEIPISGPLAAIVAEAAADESYQAALTQHAKVPRLPAPGLVDSLKTMALEPPK